MHSKRSMKQQNKHNHKITFWLPALLSVNYNIFIKLDLSNFVDVR